MINIRALLTLGTRGTDRARDQVTDVNNQLNQAANNAERMNRNLSRTPAPEGVRQYRTQRAITGARGAEGRNFAGLAQAGGGGQGFVAAYAETAALIFSVTAAFQALSNAAKVDQITKGLEFMGATAGVTLKNVSKGLQEVTGFGISAAEAMRSVALASSAGLAKNEIESLGVVAKGASIALGRDMSDSLDRLTKGTIKLEPELLDELGIMVRLDDAVAEYARVNNKAASALTLTEKRQAFLNAVLAEGEEKFGDLAKNADVSPYDRIAAGVKELGTEVLILVNNAIMPFLDLLTKAPVIALLPFAGLLNSVATKIFPTFDTAMSKSGDTLTVYDRKLGLIANRTSELGTDLTNLGQRLDRSGRSLGLFFAPTLTSPSLDTDLQRGQDYLVANNRRLVAQIDAEILTTNNRITGATEAQARVLRNQVALLSSARANLIAMRNTNNEILVAQNKQLVAQATLNMQVRQRGILEEFNENLLSRGILTSTFTALGSVIDDIVVPAFRRADQGSRMFGISITANIIRMRALGIAAITTARVIGIAFLQVIPIIGQIVMIGSLIVGAFQAMESAAKKQERKLIENLKNINENAKEVEKQINKAFEREDYGAGFESAINSLTEIIDALKEIQDLRNKALSPEEEPIVSKGFLDSFKRAAKETKAQEFLVSPVGGFGLLGKRTLDEMGEATAETSAEAQAQNIALRRVEIILGKEYAKQLKARIKDGADEVAVLEEAETRVKGISSSWSSVASEVKEVNKALKQYYGKPITETTYSPVVSGLINVRTELQAVQSVYSQTTEQSQKALEGLYNSLSEGGSATFAELDRLANDATFSFLKTSNEIENLDSIINVLKNTDNFATNPQYIEAVAKRTELALEVVNRATSRQIVMNAQIVNTKEQELQKRQALLNFSKKQLDLEKNVAEKTLDIFKTNRDIERLKATGTKEVSEAQKTIDAISDAEKIASIQNAGFKIRQALILLEFELEELKLTRAQEDLRSTVNSISAYTRLDGAKTGSEIAKGIYEGLGEDKSLQAFSGAISASRFFATSDVGEFARERAISEEEIGSLYAYASGAEYTTKALETLNNVKELSLALDRLTAEQGQKTVELLVEEAKAYLHTDNVAKRRLETEKKELENTQKMAEAKRIIRDLEEETQSILKQAKAASEGREYSTVADERRALQNTIEDLKQARMSTILANNNALTTLENVLIKAQDDLDKTIARTDLGEAREGIVARAQTTVNEAQAVYTAALDESINKLRINTTETDKASAALVLFEAKLVTLEGVIRDVRRSATEDLAITQAGMGMNILGAGDTFRSLVEQAAKDEKFGGDIFKVLADEDAMARIRQVSAEIEYMSILTEGLDKAFGNLGDSITEAFMGAIEGSKNLAQAFGEMAQQIIRDLAAMIVKMLVFKLIQMSLNFIAPGAAGGPGLGDSLMSLLNPEKKANGGLVALANGGIMDARSGLQGIVSKPTYLIGEGRYNEAVVPLPNGKAIPVQMHGSSQSNNVQVNVTMTQSGTQTQTSGQDMGNLGQAIAVAVQKELIAQKMPGGILNRYGAA